MKSPFKFLNAFTVDDQDVFFGRDEEIKKLYQLAFKTNLLLVYGMSGTGKTSLIQCGLSGKFDDSEWYPFLVRRQDDINDSLRKMIRTALEEDYTGDLVKDVQLLNEIYYRPVYILFDQFEELFILGSVEEQIACMANIQSLLNANLPCKIIIIMREEYIGRLYPYEQTIPSLFNHRFRVEPMGPLKVKEVISKSFAEFNIIVEAPEDKSIQLIIDNLSDSNHEIALPYLQVYLDILYREEYARTIGADVHVDGYPNLPLTRDEIEMLGQIDDVLSKFLEEQEKEIAQSLNAKYPNVKTSIVGKLLDAFISEEGTKRPVSIARDGGEYRITDEQILSISSLDDEVIKYVLNALEGARLLRFGQDSIELAHDSLALLIEDRRSDEQKLANQISKRIRNSYQEYVKSGTFLTRKQLESYSEFLSNLSLPPEISAFIEASEVEIERKEKESNELKKKQLLADQKINEARLIKEKLVAEKQAHKRLAVGSVLVCILLLISGTMWFTAFKRGQEIVHQKVTVDSLLNVARQDNRALTKLNSELNYVKSILDTINQTGITGDSLYLLVSQAVSSIDALNEDKVIEEVKSQRTQVLVAYTTGNRNSSTKKQTFDKGEIVYAYIFLNIPRKGDRLTMKWKDPNGNTYHENTQEMGFNMEKAGAVFWDAKGQLDESGQYTIELLNKNNEIIHELKFVVH